MIYIIVIILAIFLWFLLSIFFDFIGSIAIKLTNYIKNNLNKGD